MSAVTTHVLDAVLGRPAAGISVRLERYAENVVEVVAEARTDDDGRVRDLGPDHVDAGTYRIVFETGAWFQAAGRSTFYPEVTVTFSVTGEQPHFHVPLLLSPYAYSTYRGS